LITQVRVGKNFVNISVAITNNNGVPIDPTNAEAWLYKVSQVDGSLSLDTNINITGKVPLTKQNGQVGFYGASISTSTLLEAEYVILYKIMAELAESISVEYLSIDLSKKKIIDNLDTKISEVKTETDKIKYILGLVQENFRILNPIYDASHNLLSATIKIYPTKVDCESDTNAIAIYTMTASYNIANEMVTYQIIKE